MFGLEAMVGGAARAASLLLEYGAALLLKVPPMRKPVIFSLILALAAIAHGQQLSTKTKITYAWTQAGSSAPLCASATSTSCGVSYALTLTDPTGKVNPAITIKWPATSYAFVPGGALYCGDWKASLTLTYQDDQAATQTTTAITNTTTVPCPFVLSPPSGFTGTPGN